MIEKSDFSGYAQYTISSERLRVGVIALGATVTSLAVDGRNVILNYPTLEGYLQGNAYVGAIVGRCANRIAGGRITLQGKSYRLTQNEGENQLHGGVCAFDRQRWQAEVLDGQAVRFTYFSPDGENGYPGNLAAAVTYRVEGACLRLDFEADSDQDTFYAPTSHLYFNLDGAAQVLGTQLRINASHWVPVDRQMLPTGRLEPTQGAFDFSSLRPVGRDYDHSFLLRDAHALTAAVADLQMDLYTDFPAVQIYTGAFLSGFHHANQGLAIEPGFCPDSPNQPAFTSPLLKRGVHFHKYAAYQFSAPKED